MAFCVASAIDGVQEQETGSGSKLDEVEHIIGFDLADYWQPSADNYFKRVNKEIIADALTEVGKADQASLVAKMKKRDAATLAENEMQDSHWLPETLKRKPLAAAEDGDSNAPEDKDSPAEGMAEQENVTSFKAA